MRAVPRAHLREISECYERALRKTPSLKGKIVLGWTVKPDGSTADIEVVSDTMGDVGVARCLAEQPRTWTYPRPKDGAPIRVSYPFVFSPAVE